MDENLINQTPEGVQELDMLIDDVENDIDTEEIVDVITVDQEEEVVIDIGESMGWVSGDNRYHDSLLGVDFPRQHPIESITNLREELDEIERLKTVYSDKFNVANYYKWENDAAYDTHGYFVSIVESDKIQICNGQDIFGVVVKGGEQPDAGFIGGQDIIRRDNSYGLVVTSGLVDVRCELDVNVGDYVVSNSFGYAKKSASDYGYKVVGTATKDGVPCATIVLGVQSDTTNLLGMALSSVEDRVSINEKNIVSAINVANRAYNMAESAESSASVSLEQVEDALKEILGFGETLDDIEKSIASSSVISAQAKAIAESAVTSAASMKNEAVEKANKALDETVKVRDDFNKEIDASNDVINKSKEKLDALAAELTPLSEWKSEDGSQLGVTGFVSKADDNSATLASITKFEGEFGKSITGFVQEATKENATVAAIASYQKKDEEGHPYGPSGASVLAGQVDENAATIRILTQLDGDGFTSLSGLVSQVNENSASVKTLASHIVGEFENTDDWIEDGKDKNKVYYAKNNFKYYYYDKTEQKWMSTDKAYEAGLDGSIAGVQSIADNNSAQIQGLTVWQGKTETNMARIEQKADANGAYIQSTVTNLDRYSVGPYSQAYGFTTEQADNVLEEGMIYVPTEDKIDDKQETYKVPAIVVDTWNALDKDESKVYYAKDTKWYWYCGSVGTNKLWLRTTTEPVRSQSRSFVRGYLYQWSKINGGGQWITVDKDYDPIESEYSADPTSAINTSSMAVYFSTVEIAIGDKNNYGYWYTNGSTITDINGNTGTYEPYTLYKWEPYFDDNGEQKYRWVAVATLAGNYQSRAVSFIRQDANNIELSVTSLNDAYAGIQTKLDADSAKVNSIAAWPSDAGKDKFNMAILKQHSDGNSAHLALAAVRDVDGNGNVEVDELGGAKIVLADNAGGSYIQMDADHINFEAGKYTVKSDHITFTDSTDYTVLSKNITLNANQITFQAGDFGGRNLILNTSTPITLTASSSNQYKYQRFDPTIQLRHGKTYSFGADVTVNAGVKDHKIVIGIFNDALNGSSDLVALDIVGDYDRADPPNSYSGHISGTITISKVTEPACLLVYAGTNGTTASNSVTFSNIKLEEGKISTAWTTAPEDVDNQILTIEGKIALDIVDAGDGTKYTRLKASAGKIKFDANNIEINATNFKLAVDGTVTASNANIEGTITAGSGSNIAGWETNGNAFGKCTDKKSTEADDFYDQNARDKYYFGVGMSAKTDELGTDDTVFAIGTMSSLAGTWKYANFHVNGKGKLFAKNAEISGKITATSGSNIAGWETNGNFFGKCTDKKSTEADDFYDQNARDKYYFGVGMSAKTDELGTDDTVFAIGTMSSLAGTWKYANFHVNGKGKLFAKNAEISGTITALDGGKIGDWNIENGMLEYHDADNAIYLSPASHNGEIKLLNIKSKIYYNTEINKYGHYKFAYQYINSQPSFTFPTDGNMIFGLMRHSNPADISGDDYIGMGIVYNAVEIRNTKASILLDDTIRFNGVEHTDSSISDVRLKHSIESLPLQYEKLFDDLRPTRYKYIDGTSNRYHTGFIAQEVVQSLENVGLTTLDFAAVVLQDPGAEKELWQLRRDEFVALNTWQIQKLKPRVSTLEEKVHTLEERIQMLETENSELNEKIQVSKEEPIELQQE